MSPLDFILGLPGVEVIRSERGSTLQVWAQPTRRPSCMYCQSAPVRIKAKGLTARKVRTLLPEFMALVGQFRQSPARKMAETLSSWFEPIIRMWRFTKSNGITEGFHTKMEMLSRRAFGFRNFENYRLRVLAHCGWDGVINRV